MLNYKDFASKRMTTEKEVSLESMKFSNELNKNGTVKAVTSDNIWLNQLSLKAIEAAAANGGKLKIVFRKKDSWKTANWVSEYDWNILQEEENV